MNLVRAVRGRRPSRSPATARSGRSASTSPEPRAFTRGDLGHPRARRRVSRARASPQRFAHDPPMVLRVVGRPTAPSPPASSSSDKYYVTGRLGDGGQSSVLFARDRLTGQLVAVKVMRAALDEGLLVREAAALSRVRHANVVQVHGWGRTRDGAALPGARVRRGADPGGPARRGAGDGRAALPHERGDEAGARDRRCAGDAARGGRRPRGPQAVERHPRRRARSRRPHRLRPRPRRRARAGDVRASAGGTPGYSAPEQLVTGRGGGRWASRSTCTAWPRWRTRRSSASAPSSACVARCAPWRSCTPT